MVEERKGVARETEEENILLIDPQRQTAGHRGLYNRKKGNGPGEIPGLNLGQDEHGNEIMDENHCYINATIQGLSSHKMLQEYFCK